MLQSMTGFGAATFETPKMAISVEIKTLNSKFSDIYCRIPKTFSSREIEVRNLLLKELERGKIEFNLNIVPKSEEVAGTTLNRPLVKSYFNDLLGTAAELGFEASKTEVLRMATMMPNAFNTNIVDYEEIETEWKEILEVIMAAINKCKEFRAQEGLKTALIFGEYIDIIEQHLEAVKALDPKRIPIVKERLEKAVSDFVNSDNFDKNRFEQELIYYVEKYDISEEKIRLKNHIDYYRNELKIGSNGKKLNFITQEIGREINTIGSKANDAGIQKLVVQMKDELEKIKEQTMNIL